MSVYSPVNMRESPAGSFLPTERFEEGQFVRVFLGNGRTEIGQVVSFTNERVVITTIQGYDITVSPRYVKRAFLLVLDLNGVLVARGKGTFVHRPYVDEFMKFVFTNFVVAVWTSGLERSSNPIIESVFNVYQDKLLFTYYRDACTPTPTKENPWGTIKNLQLIFSRFPKSFHSVNTIIIDDSPDKCSHPDIALCPVPFKDAQAQKDDDGLKKAIEVLSEVLAVDSHAPVIRAAEERLEAIRAGVHGTEEAEVLKKKEEGSSGVQSSHRSGPAAPLEEVNLWKSRLCCDHLRGCCTRGGECYYSHDEDDLKRPCSRKNNCTYGHADRWIMTDADYLLKETRPQRKWYYNDTDTVSLSAQEIKDIDKPGRMHTGIPHEDARLEEEARVAQSTTGWNRQSVVNSSSVGGYVSNAGSPELVFSTDPNRYKNVRISSSSGALYNTTTTTNQYSYPLVGSRTAQGESYTAHNIPAPRGSGHDQCQAPQRFPSQMEEQRNYATGSFISGPGGDSGQQPSGGRIVHLTGHSSDGTYLVRQLKALQDQKKR